MLLERYEVIRRLGAGGAGSLLLVRDRRQANQACALKLLHQHRRDPGLIPLFRNEFLLLAEVHHPSIVGAREFGITEAGEPFYTMDFLPGENCRAFVREDRLEPREYIDLARQMLDALAHVHARRIIHRDLKPENIIMRRGDDGLQSVLIDFGLALTAGAQRAGEASGTLPYLAPEILAGASAGPPADLFGLGMVLFEICTGKEIAPRADLLREPERCLAPERVRRLFKQLARGSVPRRFEELACKLVAPTPAGRPASAVEAMRALADLYGDEFGPDAALAAGAGRALGELPLVGRARALKAIVERIEALTDARLLEPLLVVAGPEGVGTTRLLAALRNRAAVAGCLVCSGGNLRELAEDVAAHPVAGDGAGSGETPSEQVFRIDTMLHALDPQEHPVLILDNVHALEARACDALRRWIRVLEEAPGRARAMLVIGGRADGVGPGAELLQTAGGAVPLDLRSLGPLREADIRNALGILLNGAQPPPALVSNLHRTTEGSPRLLGELVRLLVEERILDLSEGQPRLDEQRLARASLPARLAEAVERRLGRLEKDARDAILRLALVPEPMNHEAARAVAGESLALLEDERFLLRDRGRIRFPSDLVRRGADLLRGEERKRALLEVAEALVGPAPAVAAGLFIEAGQRPRAREVGLPAAAELRASGRYEEARSILIRIVGTTPDLDTSRVFVSALFRCGRADEAGRRGIDLLKLHSDLELLLMTVSALNAAGSHERALALLDEACADPAVAGSPRAINARAALLSALGRYEEALEASRQAEEAAGSITGLDGRILRVRANLYRHWGRRKTARRLEDLLVSGAETELGSVPRTTALVNRANLYQDAGRMGDALRDLRAARALCRQSGQQVAAASGDWTLATIETALGRSGRAAARLKKPFDFYSRAGREEQAGGVLACWALANLKHGNPGEAEARLARLESLPGFAHSGDLQERADRVRAGLLRLSGKPEEAYRLCLSALEESDIEAVHWATEAAESALAMGDPQRAERAWRMALAEAWRWRQGAMLPVIRVGLAECAGATGAWNLAERFLGLRHYQALVWNTPLHARAALVRAAVAIHRKESAKAGRQLEEGVTVANRLDDAPLLAEIYAAAASLLEEGELQRYLRRPTASASAALLEAARDIWMSYGNETMLRKIDLHLAELPRPAGDPLAGPGAERLVKVLHITREMNREFDRDRLLGLILDRAIELTGAERGFVILLSEGREEVHIARNLDRETVSEPERKISSQIIKEVVRTGRIVRSEDAESDQRFDEYLSVRQLRLKSIIAVPFRSKSKTIGALYLDNRFRPGNFSGDDERLLELFADQAVAAIDKAAMVQELTRQRGELEQLSRRQKVALRKQGTDLERARGEIRRHRKARGWGFDRIVACSVAMQNVVREARRIAGTDVAVLLRGEPGTGKEMLARAIHYEGARQSMPFVAVNCSAYEGDRLEAALFGYVRAHRSGAEADRAGLLEEANGGTLFLAEIEAMPLSLQVKLLRALELGEAQRLGDTTPRAIDLRIIAATGADLERAVHAGNFREDILYKISGAVISLPPLRDRAEDIEPLAGLFLEEAARREGRAGAGIENDAVAKLESHPWPGNVRELRNAMIRTVVASEGGRIRPEHIRFDARGAGSLPGLDPERADRILDALVNQSIELNRRQQSGVIRVLTRGRIGFGEYRDMYQISRSTTSRDLDSLVRLGLLEKRGRTRAVVYVPGQVLLQVASRVGEK